jgi:hypothetical protein
MKKTKHSSRDARLYLPILPACALTLAMSAGASVLSAADTIDFARDSSR